MSTTAIKVTQYALAGLALATLVAGHVLEWGLPEHVSALLLGLTTWLGLPQPAALRKAP